MFFKILSASAVSRTSDEDLCSQFNHMWTAYIIAALGFLVTLAQCFCHTVNSSSYAFFFVTFAIMSVVCLIRCVNFCSLCQLDNQYVGDPILCWCPVEFPEVQCNYTKALCWVKQNYYKHEDDYVEPEPDSRQNITVSYYPWVPWFLFFMAAVLNLPHFIWRAFSKSSGLDLLKLITLANANEDIEGLAKIIRIWLVRTNSTPQTGAERTKKVMAKLGFFWLGKHYRTYLCGLLLYVKVTYLLVSVGLYFLMNLFIDEDYLAYGFDVIGNYIRGVPMVSVRFPRQTMCDMKIKHMGFIHVYSIQCILPINLYNEKIFIFLWFWFHLLITMNAYSLFVWAFRLLSPARRRKFVKGYVIIVHHLLQQKQSEPVHQNGHVTALHNGHSGPGSSLTVPRSHERASTARIRRTGRLRTFHDAVFSDKTELLYGNTSSIETNEKELREQAKALRIKRITTRMLKHFGHDGVFVFRTVEQAVGIVTANQIFQELYEQMNATLHFS